MTEVDLASRALGGSVVAASDESFGFKERLIDPAEPAFVPGTYDLRGEVVDGWETRRHAADGDWAIVRLGVGGRLRTIDVDTRFFAGNHPTGCRIDACVLDPVADPTAAAVQWTTIVATAALKPDSHNAFAVADPRRYTHVRLQLHSDGGVARLRAYGEVIPDPALWADVTVEVSGVEQGGRVEWSSDSFYSDACALIAPDRPRNMGDGWETRRRRDIGPDTHDAVMISFVVPADLQRIEIDTSRFVFNASPEVAVLGSRARPCGEHGWALVPFDVEVLGRTRHRTRCPTGLRGGRGGHHRAAGAGVSGRRNRPRPGLRQANGGRRRATGVRVGGIDMSVLMTECNGLWRRTLLIATDGSHDTGTGVAWLQGITAYVDTRGFAGRLSQHGDVFEWQRQIDVEPPGHFPDAGRMRWEAGTLIEVGVHQDYVEHWVRQDGPATPCWALFLENADPAARRSAVRLGGRQRSGAGHHRRSEVDGARSARERR